MLDQIRTTVPATARGQFYAISAAVVAALVAWGALDEALAPAVVGVVTAAVTLLFAIAHSTSPWRQALYALGGAVAVLAVAVGWATNGQTDALLAILAPVLGIGVAAATTPTSDELTSSGRHSSPLED